MAKIAHNILEKCAIFHIIIFFDITTAYMFIELRIVFGPTLQQPSMSYTYIDDSITFAGLQRKMAYGQIVCPG